MPCNEACTQYPPGLAWPSTEPALFIPCFPGLTAYHKPSTALPILLAILAFQCSTLGLVLCLRPYVSSVLNFAEAACGGLDIATLALTAWAYKIKLSHTQETLASEAATLHVRSHILYL
jgi:hypothetical protein